MTPAKSYAETKRADAVLCARTETQAPEPELTVCEWSDVNVVVSCKASAKPDQFRSAHTP